MYQKKIITFYTKYSTRSASVRERIVPYAKFLQKKKYKDEIKPLINNDLFYQRVILGNPCYFSLLISCLKRILDVILQEKNIVVIQHELIPFFPPLLERLLFFKKIPYIIDIDDAVFHNYDKSSGFFTKFFLKNKFRSIFTNSALVFSGNKYLEKKVKLFGAKKIFLLPTTVSNSNKKFIKNKKFTVVWVGSPSTTKYLDDIEPEITRIASNHHINFVFIGCSKYTIIKPNKNIKFVDWSLNNQSKLIGQCHVGIMPLRKTYWELGKCGYKMLLYMKYGLPVLCSPIGVNKNIVEHGKNGFFISNTEEWPKYLIKLKNSNKLANKLGRCGKNKILKKYTINSYQEDYFKQIEKIKIV